MTDYRELAAAELDKIRRANNEIALRAKTLRADGRDGGAEELEAGVTATSFRLAQAYSALAAMVPPAVTVDVRFPLEGGTGA